MAVKRKNNTQKRRRMNGGGLFDWLSGKPAEPVATESAVTSTAESASAPVPEPAVTKSAAESAPHAEPVSVAGPVAAPKKSFMEMLGFSTTKGGKRLSKKAKAKKSKSKK